MSSSFTKILATAGSTAIAADPICREPVSPRATSIYRSQVYGLFTIFTEGAGNVFPSALKTASQLTHTLLDASVNCACEIRQ
jgi:hypothetical protein